jgi:essential nuclear protein 1
MPKATTPKADRPARRHHPLENDILATGLLRNKPNKKAKHAEGADESFVDSKASKNILRIGRELAEEENAERAAFVTQPTVDAFGYDSRFDDGMDDGDEAKAFEDDEAWGDDDEVVEEVEVDPEDLEMYKKFMPDEEDDLLKHGWDLKPSGDAAVEGESRNLADIILQKIAAHEAAEARKESGMPVDDYELPPKIVEVYTK